MFPFAPSLPAIPQALFAPLNPINNSSRTVSKQITIGVIGCGYWGPNLLRNFAENEAAQLRWICDTDEERLNAMARRYPAAQITTDYQKLLSDPLLDAVAVVTPVATHFQITKAALLAGKHVLVEKPL